MYEALAMTTGFHDREPARKEEGDEKRQWTRLVPFRKSIGNGQSITLPKGTLGRDAVLGRAWSTWGDDQWMQQRARVQQWGYFAVHYSTCRSAVIYEPLAMTGDTGNARSAVMY